MYCIGLTGSIASGKSTVAGYFAGLGIATIHADAIAKRLTTNNQPLLDAIISHFGKSILTTTGELDRRLLRQRVFSNQQERQWLEQLLHPSIRTEIEQEISKSNTPYCLIEIPLLKDRSTYPYLNRILLVKAKHEQQIARFISRDNGSKASALAILAAQPDDNTLHAIADDVLNNTGSFNELQKKVKELHVKYLEYTKITQQ